MSDDIKVIRSFLVSLGFTVDITQQRKFGQGVEGADNKIKALSKSLAGAGVAAAVMVKQFSNEMEKLYYSSRRTGASVQGIQSLESGMQRIGLQAGTAKEAIEELAYVLKSNPAMQSQLDLITGGKTKGMKADDQVVQLIKSLSQKPDYQSIQLAESFNMSGRTYLMLKQGLPELEAARKKREALNEQFGVDAQKFSEAAVKYNNSLRDIADSMEVIGEKIVINLIGPFQEVAKFIQEALDSVFKAKNTPQSEQLWAEKTWAEKMAFSWKNRDKNIDGFIAGKTDSQGNPVGGASTGNFPPKTIPNNKADYLKSLEKRDGHKPGLLDSVWLQESTRGTDPKRLSEHDQVLGDWQLGRKTASDHHLALNDRLDYYKSADVASKYLKELRDRYHGRTDFALAAYNSGMGNFEKRGMSIGASPLETRKYVRDIMGRVNGDMNINQTTNINVTGTGSQDTAKSVVDAQKKVNSDLARNFRSRVN